MTRVFVTPEEFQPDFMVLTGENAKHAKVLRLKNGEVISSMALPDGALGITAEGGRTASILFPAMALTLRGE
jgi:16S rRNA U1498 N3-methylase RsmE